MSSTRIDLRTNATSGCLSNVKMFEIERTMPAVMDGYMMSHEWQEFCDRVDSAMEPMAKTAKIAMISFWLCFLGGVVAVAVFFTLFWKGDVSTSLFPDLLIVVVPVVVMSFVVTAISCYGSVIGQRVKQSIIQICEDTSNRNSSLSVHFREETYVVGSGDNRSTKSNWYIEVSIKQDAVSAVGVPSESAVKRLEDLEAVRSMLSPEEYDEKRARILEKL